MFDNHLGAKLHKITDIIVNLKGKKMTGTEITRIFFVYFTRKSSIN